MPVCAGEAEVVSAFVTAAMNGMVPRRRRRSIELFYAYVKQS